MEYVKQPSGLLVPKSSARRGNEMDAFALPNGAMVIPGALDRYLDRNPIVRERLERADQQTGMRSMCLVRRGAGNAKPGTVKEIDRNAEFANSVIKRRIGEENLKESERTNANMQNRLN
jgi:hypothetical protein